MAILRVNAAEGGRVFSHTGGDWRAELACFARAAPKSAPVVILLHGLRYSWRAGRGCDPHATLYRTGALPETRRTRPERANWPHLLGFSEHGVTDGLCIAFGWDAGGLSDLRMMEQVKDRYAPGLCAVLDAVRSHGLTADLFGHSLGAALGLAAISACDAHRVRRAILLGPAERREAARRALGAARRTEFIHVLARANDLFDEAFSRLSGGGGAAKDCRAPLGAGGLGDASDRWIDIQIDHPDTKSWLSARANAPMRRRERVSHWVYYSDPTAMALYRDILRDPAESAISSGALRDAPRAIEPRWSRLRPKPPLKLFHGGDNRRPAPAAA